MSSASPLSGVPAFTALLPGYPHLEDLDAERTELLVALFGRGVRAQSLGPAGATPEGRYVVEHGAAGARLFVKIFPEDIAPLQRHGARVAAFLADRGVPVIVALDQEPRPVAPGYRAMTFAYFDARFSALAPPELEALGAAIARVHAALREYPERERTRDAGERLRARLEGAARAIVAAAPAGDVVGKLRLAAASSFLAGSWRIFTAPQMVHGDCNYTNALFAVSGGELRLVDFEESAAAFLAPIFDVAMIVQRFVLMAPPERRQDLAGAFFDGYARASGAPPPREGLRQAIIEATYRSVLILSEKIRAGAAIPAAEWTKFARLAELTAEKASFLSTLEGATP